MPKKILVVDDDELTKQLLSRRLEQEDYDVITASNGAEAVQSALRDHPDVVIMDIMLPDMQGSDAVRNFQENPQIEKRMRIVFLSGIISDSDEEDTRIQVGGVFYPAVAKPVDFDQLLRLIS